MPNDIKECFFGDSVITKELGKKYTSLIVYSSSVDEIHSKLDDKYRKREYKLINEAKDVAYSTDFDEITFSESKCQIDFSKLSIKKSKYADSTVVLYADIRGFTNKVDNSELNDIKKFTDEVLKGMYSKVKSEQGVHVQFQGDRESAIFSSYVDENQDNVCRSIFSAMKMLDMVDQINKSRDVDKLDIGIGCAMGQIFATRIGIRNNKFNVVMGKTVKDADTAEDEVAGSSLSNSKSEIVITKDIYNYLSEISTRQVRFIVKSFAKRQVGANVYYVSTTRFTALQEYLDNKCLEKNALEAKKNKGIRAWGV